MAPEAYEEVNRAWKGTCRAIFGTHIGELEEFGPYLGEVLVGRMVGSAYSSKEVMIGSRDYCKGARFFDFNSEHSEYDKILSKPLDINKIKDIDSLVDAVSEKIVYAGNKTFGNSKNVEASDSIMDSSNIFNSSRIIGGKYIAYCHLMQFSEYSFGSSSSGQSSHIAKCFGNNKLNRCFEVCGTMIATDCYFSYNVSDCNECLFSFNLRSKRHVIANIELEKENYIKLKEKLLGEIIDELRRKKRYRLSILDIMRGTTT
jgi:hypothetical protein